MILVDFHAEATSEKQAMGFYLDGRVSAVVGTHTHVPTADERVLPERHRAPDRRRHDRPLRSRSSASPADKVLERFLSRPPRSFEVAKRDVRLAAP